MWTSSGTAGGAFGQTHQLAQGHKPIKEDKGRAGYLCNLNGFYNYFFAQELSATTRRTPF